ncbi:MAG: hypothetical protein J6X87_05675 [Clostridia bacterium]|nr:hypothetical protein [Clostridia bacterium]
MKLSRKINIGLICLGIAIVACLVYVIAACSINEKDRRDIDTLMKQFETDLVKWELSAKIGDTPEQLLADADKALSKYYTGKADSTAAVDSIEIKNEVWSSIEKDDKAVSIDASVNSFSKATATILLTTGNNSGYSYETVVSYTFSLVKIKGEWKIEAWESGYNYYGYVDYLF